VTRNAAVIGRSVVHFAYHRSKRARVLKRIRIAILLYVLLFVALGEFLTKRFARDWDTTLTVHVYPIATTAAVDGYVDRLGAAEFEDLEQFIAAEARRYGVALEFPMRVRLAPRLDNPPPALANDASVLGVAWWSLRMRWHATAVEWRNDAPRADIVVFAQYHDDDADPVLDRSMALEKGLIAIANLFAESSARGANQVVLAHEILHTLGATDKYDLATNSPRHPDGFAEPHAQPLYPQRRAELMAGRIALAPNEAAIPDRLREVVIGPVTALEIGWTRGAL
jgi:hypothetical protein